MGFLLALRDKIRETRHKGKVLIPSDIKCIFRNAPIDSVLLGDLKKESCIGLALFERH